ncbi:putative retinal pigment epithelial membrane protein [Rosellinia necatrix]|uniref:Putative retinal pigment epithelial membrane protein n=1 Tax=Rosellinia necatrix TaxID=77044 RepID=A0A1S8A6Q8_ROSNE|nr:putative retinal pigment epithelial membrane protein [Rosellinia necatrix]
MGNSDNQIAPHFVNQYILTDVFLNAKDNGNLRRPLLPSISTLISGSFLVIILVVARAILLIILSRLPGSRKVVEKISVANTGVVYHDGRALATCESGPPMRIQLPGLETIGWYNGIAAGNEPYGGGRGGFGGKGPAAFMKEWTTGHPRVDPITEEFISIHAVFVKPYVFYSVVPASGRAGSVGRVRRQPMFDVPIPGIRSPKMMHDFGVASHHTVILDLPLSLDPMRCISGKPIISFDSTERSRFGVFPRYRPHQVQWFETNPCVIFHTANCWETASVGLAMETCVHLVVCRLTSASVLYSAGALSLPIPEAVPPEYAEEEQCRLYYYSFPLAADGPDQQPMIRDQWALSAIPFEFPSVSSRHAMSSARFIYGCSMGSTSSYSPGLGKAAKIDYLAKLDIRTLIARGTAHPPRQIKGCVDRRTVDEIMQSQDVDDPIRLFPMPKGWYAQEPRFVSRHGALSEDDGWLLTYVFDETQLDEEGECGEEAVSELWVIDAKGMRDVVARIRLPQRVPYGLHGAWFSEREIADQKMVEAVRRETTKAEVDASGPLSRIRDIIEKAIG